MTYGNSGLGLLTTPLIPINHVLNFKRTLSITCEVHMLLHVIRHLRIHAHTLVCTYVCIYLSLMALFHMTDVVGQ